jgi:3-oxoacyl-[acyl-carrier protein] reductase
MMLQGKVCFITGSSQGIGWATAQLFAASGATVILNGRNADRLEARSQELRERFGVDAVALPADASDAAAVKACYAEIFRRFKQLDVLVNNAGILQDALLGMISEKVIQDVIGINVIGPILHLQEASRLMGRRKQGSIINVSSIIGRVGNEGQAVYAASKAAVIGLTLAAAKELASRQIRVNAIAPGFIDTNMTQQLSKEKHDERMRSIKMGRIGRPEDIAQGVLFFASEMSSYVTGQVLGIDGGMLV